MFIQTLVKPSNIFGRGLFTAEPVRKGKIVCCFTTGAKIITEEQFLQGIRDETHVIVRTGTRYAGQYFTVGNEDQPYTFINHSLEPNLLCHCGLVIALRDLPADEEMTIDYRTLIDETDLGIYNDAKSGEPIRGFSAKETLLRTARQLIELVEPIDGWVG